MQIIKADGISRFDGAANTLIVDGIHYSHIGNTQQGWPTYCLSQDFNGKAMRFDYQLKSLIDGEFVSSEHITNKVNQFVPYDPKFLEPVTQ